MNEDGRSRSDDGEASDNALLMEVAHGDRLAFRRLMERHTRGLLAMAERITGNAADAEEIVQETFLKIWTMAARWRPDRHARFSTWLYRVTLNACIDRRRKVAWLPLEDADEPVDPRADGLDVAMAGQCLDVLGTLLDQLPARQKQALVLHYFGDVSAPQAARILEITVPAVESLLIRGKRALKQAMSRRGINRTGDLR